VSRPSGDWQYLGESSVNLSASRHVDAAAADTLETNEAGTHHLVYGLYRGEELVLSGSLAFDVGSAVMIGLSTDRFEYKSGAENVLVKADYFGNSGAQLQLYLDNEIVDTRSLTLDGVGSLTITLNSNRVAGGNHGLRAVLTAGGLVSKKSTTFIYGSELPDLTLVVSESNHENLIYEYRILVENRGKSPSGACSLEFKDNGVTVSTVAIPALTAGQSHEAVFTWKGSGKAGDHDFEFIVDPTGNVKEFLESNNRIEFSETVPALFYTLEVQPQIWAANTEAAIISRLINNKASVVSLSLETAVVNENSGETIFSDQQTVEVTPFAARSITATFNTGVFLAGSYRVSQWVRGTGVEKLEELYVTIEPTKAISVGLNLTPGRITAGLEQSLTLGLSVENRGNVNLEDETLTIRVVDDEGDPKVDSKDVIFSLAIAGNNTLEEELILNLEEGAYRVKVLFLDEEVASADLLVVPALEKKKEVNGKARVSIMCLDNKPQNRLQAAGLANLLSRLGIANKPALGMEPAYMQMHGNEHNVSVVLGNARGNHILDELQERVFWGEGLILLCDSPLKGNAVADFLGMTVETIPGKKGETRVQYLDSPLGAGGVTAYGSALKHKLVPITDDVKVLGQGEVTGHPVMAYRPYGMGYVLVMTVPLEAVSGGQYPAGILAGAITSFAQDVYNLSALTRVLPMELVLTNKGGSERSYTVKELLPYGVESYGHVPVLEDKDELQWPVNIPAAGSVSISYWLKLPDSLGDYEITSEIYSDENLVDQAALSFSVNQTVGGHLSNLIADISTMTLSGKDGQLLVRAKEKLLQIQSRSGQSLTEALYNLQDAVAAANLLSQVASLDTTQLRRQTIALLRALARLHYEKQSLPLVR